MRGGDEKNSRPLQPLKRRHRLTGRYPPKVQAAKVKALLGREAEYRAKIFKEESVRVRHVTCGTFSCLNHKSEYPCTFGEKCKFRHVEEDGQPSKKSKKSSEKRSVALLKESIQLGCVSSRSLSENFFYGKKIGIKSHRRILQGNVALHQYSYARRNSKV